MLTQCPNCQTIYQITAEELGAANAFVECGECGNQFNALDRIADEPKFDQTAQKVESDVAETDEPVAASEGASNAPAITLLEEPSLQTPAPPIGQKVAQEFIADETQTPLQEPVPDIEPEIQSAAEINEQAPIQEALDTTIELAVLNDQEAIPDSAIRTSDNSRTSLSPQEHEILFTEPGQDENVPTHEDDEDKVVAADEIDLEDVPPILQEELLALQGGKKQSAKWYWTVMASILFIGLLAQAAWYYRDRLLAEFPQIREPAFALCEVLDCNLQAPEKTEPIQLVSRDVRTHPRYENALLVNASMVNTSVETIDFPTVQLGLFDNTGAAIGIRQFEPPEYLDKSIDIAAGIPPGRSVHVVMELANAAERATSFEFSFY